MPYHGATSYSQAHNKDWWELADVSVNIKIKMTEQTIRPAWNEGKIGMIKMLNFQPLSY